VSCLLRTLKPKKSFQKPLKKLQTLKQTFETLKPKKPFQKKNFSCAAVVRGQSQMTKPFNARL